MSALSFPCAEQPGRSTRGWQWCNSSPSSSPSSGMGCRWDTSFHHTEDLLHVPPRPIFPDSQRLGTCCSPARSFLCSAGVLTIPAMWWGLCFGPCWDKQDSEIMASCFISPSCRHFQNVIDIFDLHNTESTEDLFFSTPKQYFFFFLGGGNMAFQMNLLSLASIFPLVSFTTLQVVCFETAQTLPAWGQPNPFEGSSEGGCCKVHWRHLLWSLCSLCMGPRMWLSPSFPLLLST